jgi:hypothetical protein
MESQILIDVSDILPQVIDVVNTFMPTVLAIVGISIAITFGLRLLRRAAGR